ncbi:MAG: hypothetical protein MUF68_01205 [Cyclobacteriaceae bacterium]|jgi:hypothetical protein|nr:hypothetical protein [Cyclobacteriaceae bacterium]
MSVLQSIGNLLRFNKRNWKAVVLCLLASTVFWFFNALNKTYTTTLTFPLEWQYNTDNFIAVTPLPQTVKINVTGIGWSLLRHDFGVKSPALVIPLERPSEVKKIVGSTLPALLTPQLNDLQIKFVVIDTLYISIEPIQGKFVKLVVDPTKLSFRQGYGISSTATVVPDSVFVQGPASVLATLPKTIAITAEANRIDENVETTWPLKWPHPQIKSEPEQAQVSFQVQKLISMKDSVRVTLQNIPNGKKVSLPASPVMFEFSMPENMYEDLYQRQQIQALVDVSKAKPGKPIAPRITGLPPFSKVTAVDSVMLYW